MYIPYPGRRKPTNRECRVASIVSIIGFIGFGWMVLSPPDGFFAFLGEPSLVLLFSCWLGLGTLLHARPCQGLLWPQIKARLDSGSSRPRVCNLLPDPVRPDLGDRDPARTAGYPYQPADGAISWSTRIRASDIDSTDVSDLVDARPSFLRRTLAFLAILWIFSVHVPGGLRTLFR